MPGGVGAFAFYVRKTSSTPAPEGLLFYYDSAARRSFLATEITLLIVVGNHATFYGEGREHGGPTVPFRVEVTDAMPDTFQILWPGYTAGGVVRGDIRVSSACHHGKRR